MKPVCWGGRTAAESPALQHKSHSLLNALKSITNWPSGQCRGRIFFRPRQPWHVGCIPARSGTRVASFACDLLTSFALTPLRDGGSAYRRPPVWRAVVRPARYFFAFLYLAKSRLRRFLQSLTGASDFRREQKAWFLLAIARWRRRFFPRGCVPPLLPRQRGQAPHHRHEGVEINRLGDMEVEAGFHGGGDIAFGGVTCHRNRKHAASDLQSP